MIPAPANKAFLEAWHAEYGPTSLPDFPAIGAWNAMEAVYGLIRAQGDAVATQPRTG